jgi:hypothetical protein
MIVRNILIRMRCSSFSFDVNLYAYELPMI